MELHEWISAFFICLAANIDVLAAAISRQKQLQEGVPAFHIGWIVISSTAVTAISCLFGQIANEYIPPQAANAVSATIFILLALLAIKKELLPRQSDTKRKSGIFLLAFALACNNIGLGIAYGVSGKSFVPITLFTFTFTLLCCLCGIFCAKKLRRYLSERSLTLLSNILLLGIGLLQLFQNLVAGRF